MGLVKILFVHEVSYRKKVVFEMHEFPELLAAAGHQVEFFDFDEAAKFWDGGLTPQSQTISGRVHPETRIKVQRPFQLGIPGIDRMLATITSRFALDRLLATGKFNAVVLLAVPTYGLQTLRAANRHGVPVAFRALDVSHKIRNNALGWAIKQVEKRIYNRADLLLGNNPAMTAYCERLGIRTRPSKTLLAPVDLSHFSGVKLDPALASKLSIGPNERVITYMGSFFYFSGLDEIIQRFSQIAFESKNADLKLLLIGGGEQDADLRSQVKTLGLTDRVTFTGFIGYQDLPKYLALSTVAINPLKKSLVTDTALPHKVLQYLALGLPVVSTPLDGLKAVFGDSAGIRWADTPAQLLDAAVEFASDSEALQAANEMATASVAIRLSRDGAVSDLVQALEEMIGDYRG